MPLSKIIPSLQSLLDTDLDDDPDIGSSSGQATAWAAALDLHCHREHLRHVRRWLSVAHHVVFYPVVCAGALLAFNFRDLSTTMLPGFIVCAIMFMVVNAWVSHGTDLAIAATFSKNTAVTAWQTSRTGWQKLLWHTALFWWWPLCLTVVAVALLAWIGFLLLSLIWILGLDLKTGTTLLLLVMDDELRLEAIRVLSELLQDSDATILNG